MIVGLSFFVFSLAHVNTNMSATITWPSDPNIANPLVMGCHTDSGYVGQPFGRESQMIAGESFEGNWTGYVPLRNQANKYPNISWNQLYDGKAKFSSDTTIAFHGKQKA